MLHEKEEVEFYVGDTEKGPAAHEVSLAAGAIVPKYVFLLDVSFLGWVV